MLWGNIQVSPCPNIFCSENFVISAKIFVEVSRKLIFLWIYFSEYLSVVKMWLFSRDFWSFDCIKNLYMLRLKGVFSRKMTLLAAARKNLGHVDAFIQQTDDAHGSGTLKNLYFLILIFFKPWSIFKIVKEYTAPVDNRRPQVSGFTGSAGTAVFTKEKAALWTDGRYFLQANQELDSDWILMKDGIPGTQSIDEWLVDQVIFEKN